MNQKEQVLNHLKQHGKITSWGAIQEYGITRLSARIKDLKEDGHQITSRREKSNGKSFAVYELQTRQQSQMFGRPNHWEVA